jgi:dolichol kinase
VKVPGGGARASGFPGDLARKALHLSVAILPVAYSRGASRELILGLFGTGTVLALLIEAARWKSPPFRQAFNRWIGPILKPREHTATTGAFWLWPSCLVAVLVLSREAAVSAVWCATVGDPLAALAGNGYHAWRGSTARSGKTIVGSAACLAASFVGIVALTRYPMVAAAIIAFVATVFERLPLTVDDNVRVSVAAGVTAWLLS